jgi:hypothetical protein
LVPGTTFEKKKGSTRYQILPENFSSIFLGQQISYLDRYKYPKKNNFLNSILRFLGVLCTPVLKAKKWVLFGFSTGTKGELRIFEE